MSQNYPQSTEGIGQQMGGEIGGQTTQQPQSMGATQGMSGQGTGERMGSQFGQQTGMAHQTAHQQVGHQFESELTPELNEALEAFDRVVEVASWCADKCIESGPQMAECARLCDDLSELAELNEKLISRDSINGPEVAETFLRVAQQGLPILQQYQQPHVQETLQTVTYAIDATNKLLDSISGQPMGTQQGFQEMSQQGGMGQQSQGLMGQPGGQMGQTSQQPQGGMGQQFGGQTTQQPQSQGFQGGQTTY